MALESFASVVAFGQRANFLLPVPVAVLLEAIAGSRVLLIPIAGRVDSMSRAVPVRTL